MGQRHRLSSDQEHLSPADVVRRLEEVFPRVHVNPLLGRYRVNHLIKRLQELRAPEVIIRAHEGFREETIQLTIYDGNPLTEVLDLTVGPYQFAAYSPDGVEEPLRRAGAALGYDVIEDEFEEGELDERGSPEETKHRANVLATRRAVSDHRGRFEGAEALYVSGSLVSRMRVHNLQLTEPYFAADLELLPTPGLVNERMPVNILWHWDQFSCGPESWVSGPYVVEIFHFGIYVNLAVRYCESLVDPTYTPNRRQEIAAVVRAYQERKS